MQYNKDLVDKVVGAYASSSAMGQAVTAVTSGILSKTLSTVADLSKQKKDKLLSENVAKNADTASFNESEIDNLINFKNQYDDVATKLAKPFLGKEKKAELNKQLNMINKATSTYVRSVNHMMKRQEEAIAGDKSRSSAYDHQQHMTWDRIATGEARNEAALSVDFTTGEMFIQDPYGRSGDQMNVLNWSELKTVDSSFLTNDTKLLKNSNALAKDLTVTPDVAEAQVRDAVTNNYYTNPSAIWDHPSGRSNEFADFLIESDGFEELMESKYPSEFNELETLESNRDDEGFYDLVKQKARKEDMSEYWVTYRTQTQMSQFNSIREEAELANQTKSKNNGGGGEKYTSSQKIKFDTFVRSFNQRGNIYLGKGQGYAVKNPEGNYEIYNDAGQPLLKPGSRTEKNPKGEVQAVSYDDLVNRVGLPQEYIKQLDQGTRSTYTSGPFPGANNTNVPTKKLP
jgi:hypothetical protein